jgi:hypothetical protein
MSYLTIDLKVFEFEDGETHWIVAKTKEDAIRWYETEYAGDVVEDSYDVKEISKDSKALVNVTEDDILHKIINEYNSGIRISCVPIWQFLKYSLLEAELQGREYPIPNLVASTVF